jgi:hypothetical protein
VAGVARRDLDGSAEGAVAEDDDGVHVGVPSYRGGATWSEVGATEKPRSPGGAAALGASVPWRPGLSCRRAVSAPGPVPPGRAAGASSSIPRRRCGGSQCKSYA